MRDTAKPNTGTTPFPNFLLDRVMPRLSDSSWRVLCVIVRQTYGWVINGERKKVDWISHFQFKRMTGRQSAAVSRAISSLVRIGLVLVTDQFGNPMTSPGARRRAHSRLTFGINPAITTAEFQIRFGQIRIRTSNSENNKTKVYKTKQQHGK